MNALLYPDAERLPQLADDIVSCFAQLSTVAQIIAFGSLARSDWDRWSDLDLIVVTTYQDHFSQVFTHLRQAKPLLHHTPFTVRPEPDGAYVLGCVFADESVFHCLDLNLFSLAQVQSADALSRFGQLKILFQREAVQPHAESDRTPPKSALEDPTEKHINEAMHFTKKRIKKVLRRQATINDLQPLADHLRDVLGAYPENMIVPGGCIRQVAHTYLAMADVLLDDR